MITLKQHLNNCTKKKLIDIAKFHSVKGYSSLKKAELADRLTQHLMKEETFTFFFSYLNKEEISILTEGKRSRDFFPVRRLLEAGYCFPENSGDDICYLIPKDLPIHLLSDSRFLSQQKEHAIWTDLMTLTGNLYGCIPLTNLCKIYQNYNRKPIGIQEARAYIDSIPSSLTATVIVGDLCIQKDLLANDLYEKIQLCQGSMPYYIPSAEELNFFLSNGYFNDEHTLALFDYLMNHRKLSNKEAKEHIIELQSIFRQGGTLEEAGNYLRKHHVIIDMEIDKGLISLLNTMFSHSRLLLNRGYSESEKVAMTKPKAISKASRIYPNSPCPCGSGKKYKKCCGRGKEKNYL